MVKFDLYYQKSCFYVTFIMLHCNASKSIFLYQANIIYIRIIRLILIF